MKISFFEKNLINQIILSSPKILNTQNNFLFRQQVLKDIFVKNYNLVNKKHKVFKYNILKFLMKIFYVYICEFK